MASPSAGHLGRALEASRRAEGRPYSQRARNSRTSARICAVSKWPGSYRSRRQATAAQAGRFLAVALVNEEV